MRPKLSVNSGGTAMKDRLAIGVVVGLLWLLGGVETTAAAHDTPFDDLRPDLDRLGPKRPRQPMTQARWRDVPAQLHASTGPFGELGKTPREDNHACQ